VLVVIGIALIVLANVGLIRPRWLNFRERAIALIENLALDTPARNRRSVNE